MTRSIKKGKTDREKIYLSEKLKAKMGKIGEYPLTFIEAPIGYGKTRSCMEYLKNSEQFYIWKNISGRDCSVCWQQFCDAVSLIDESIAEKLRAGGVPENHAAAEKAAEMFGKVNREDPVIVVLDTILDRLQDSVAYFFEALARKNIENIHFVIIGRVRFRNNREELRMKHLLLIIDVFDFMLDRDDIVKYFEMCGISVGKGDAERLRRKSDGWIAALYLTILHWDENRGRLDIPDQIYDLFGQTLCREYTEEQFDFLKRISPFDNFTMDQARSVRQMRDPERILDFILNSCGFIWKIPDTSLYHINRLYREYLMKMLEKGDPELRKKAFKNAADWFFHNKSYYKAAAYYYRSGDYENMLKAFDLDKGEHLRAADLYYMGTSYQKCPEEIRNRHPAALMIYARQLRMCGKNRELEKVMELLNSREVLSSVPENERKEFEGECEILRSYMNFSDPSMVEDYQKCGAEKKKHPSIQAGRMSPYTFGSPSIMFLYYTEAGKLDELLKKYTGTRELYYHLTDNNSRGSEYLFDAEIQFNRGNLEKADILSHKAGTVAAKYNQTGTGICAYFLQARISILKGETDKGMKYLDQITSLATDVNKRIYAATGELCESYIYAVFNQLKYAADWICRGEFATLDSMRLYSPAEDFAYVVYARILIARGEYSKYLGLADELIEAAEKNNNLMAQIYHHVYCTAAYRRLSIDNMAEEYLHRAIALAGEDGIIMPFAESGRILNEMYAQVDLSKSEKAFTDRCLKFYSRYEKHMNVLLRGGSDTALSVLTRREREISLLVADGKTNKQIAGELNIAEITVKKCLSNIYARLGIPNRASLIREMIS